MKKTISVFFSGTGFSITNTNFLAASLYSKVEENEQQIKIGFDGCGEVNPFLGTIFGHGLDAQCDEVIQRVTKEIADGHKITLNIYGHSRGGIGALMLAQQLSAVDPDKLSINMALLDPVPGNLITTSTIDPLHISLANKTMDLTACKPLKRVLALYPHIPLPDYAFHAPLFASYPKGIELEEDATAGCHAEAEQISSKAGSIVETRVEEFFAKNGTQFTSETDYMDSVALKQRYLRLYLIELYELQQSTTRSAHSIRGVYINTNPNALYYNEHHKRLARGQQNAKVMLSIEESQSYFSSGKRKLAAYSISTGDLFAVLVIAIFATKFELFSTLPAAPIVETILAILLYTAIKPTAAWITNKIVYPKYSMRNIEACASEVNHGYSNSLLDGLRVESATSVPKHEAEKAPYHRKGVFNKPSNKSSASTTPVLDSISDRLLI